MSILTTDLHEKRHAELAARADPALPKGVRFLFVPEPKPEDVGGGYLNLFHLWSARVYEALKTAYPDGGPDLVEFPDFLAEGAVTAQATRTLDPALRHTTVAVRAYTSHEMCNVLNGYLPRETGMRSLNDLERYALKYADYFLWPGGDVLNTYRRFFGEHGLAPPRLVRHFVTEERSASGDTLPSDDGIFRFIYLGRLERRKGVVNLLRAATSIERDDWSLTLLGGDTPTAPLGVSMQAQLELMAADDERIEFHPAVKRDAMFELIERHHAAIFPSLWECWPFVALHAFDENRPVLATPVGGFLEMVEDGVSGWLTRGAEAPALATAIEGVLDDRESVARLIRAQEPRKALRRLNDPQSALENYVELAGLARRRSGSAARRSPDRVRPLVSAVVPYYRMERYVGETIASLFDQTYGPLEVLVVNDGSFREEDVVLAELATTYPIMVLTQENAGLGAARNFGISQARGRYVFPLDADNVATATLVERCVEVLERRDDVAYVTSWSRYIDDEGMPSPPPSLGYQPVSNDMRDLGAVNTAGDAAAVIRRRVFDRGFSYSVDATSYEDWLFYRRLERAGLHGHVIPERLLLYRVRGTSMMRDIGLPHHERLIGEMEAHLRSQEVQWTS
ncbi:MAG: glycosyltransferase [Actinomycetota bacterium]|nr:glycosyltransferase [Actinomycetota bacterium]